MEDLLLTFTVSSYSKDLDRTEHDEKNSDPNPDVDIIPPVLNGDTGGSDFEGQDSEPVESVVPADGETPGARCQCIKASSCAQEDLPRRIDESQAVCKECPVDWIEDSQLSQSLNGQEKHDTDDEISDELETVSATVTFLRKRA